MKTTIYELLGMIKDDIPVKRILFRNQVYEYEEDGKDYYNEEYGWIFDEYDLISILNEPIEILETIITYKPDKIEKLKFDMSINFIDQFTDKINEIIDRVNTLC